MTEQSIDFERRVERIHQLLEDQDAKVTWNDKLPDPDNPKQWRQIDVTIRRNGKLTLVECRIHRAPQDVMWIEELIGRRSSLRASAVIAVSASGFTEGARLKAVGHGIVLRDFQTLSDEEISNWGKSRQVQLRFLEFKNAVLRFGLPILPASPYVITKADGERIENWRGVFEAAKRRVSNVKELDGGKATPAHVEILSPMLVNGIRMSSAYLSASIRRVKRKISLTSLVAYEDPIATELRTQALVGKLDLGKSEIVETGTRALVAFDVRELKVPVDCIFDSMDLEFNPPLAMKGVQLLGLDNPGTYRLRLRFEFHLQNSMPPIFTWGR